MGRALEIIGGFATAPSTTFTSLTMFSGNSLQVRNFEAPHKAHLVTSWMYTSGTGVPQIKSPKLHDNLYGIQYASQTGGVNPAVPVIWGDDQILEAQDTLSVQIQGSAVGGKIESWLGLIFYEDLPGIDARLIDCNELHMRALNLVTVKVTHASTGTTGGWVSQRVLNFTQDQLKANTEYALLGATTDLALGCVRVQGADTGNLGIGIPVDSTQKYLCSNWFQILSLGLGAPLIPVFNSANKGGILVDIAANETSVTTPSSYLMFQELAKR